MKSKNKAPDKPATLIKPNGDGFYWLNDKNAYGWEVVQVAGDYLYRTGIENGQNINNASYNEWIKLEKPE
jgi:hypothetical protein